jgi:outer membrane protein assembly factor BamB
VRTTGRRTAGCLAAALVLSACSSGADPARAPEASDPSTSSPASTGPRTGFSSGDWLTYHADLARTGAVDGRSPDHVRRAWTASLGGAVRGQPLVANGHVIAATETNRVVALDPDTGRVQWSKTIGDPLTNVPEVAGCGNIDPLGITGTPVVDPDTGTVYVVGEVADSRTTVHHQLVGLDIATGERRVSVAVDPPLRDPQSPVNLLQRPGLALANGRIYVAYGGHFGDCGDYNGWLVGALVAHPEQQVAFRVSTDLGGGAIWQSGGAPAVDADGNVYVSTGNSGRPGSGPDPGQYAESVVELSPELEHVADFKDDAAGGDADLSTGNPVLLPDGTVFAVGKTNIGYVLDQRDLHRVAAIQGVCESNPDGGPAYDRATQRMFVPCRAGGIQVVDLAHRRLGPRLDGADSAPIVVGNRVWAVDWAGQRLVEFDAAGGDVVQTLDPGVDVPVFASPSTGDGLLLLGTTDGVVAFA